MGDVINLRQARKRMARQAKTEDAARNRARFGESASDRATRQSRATIEDSRHQAHRLAPDRPGRATSASDAEAEE